MITRPSGTYLNCPLCNSDDIQDIYIRDGRKIVCCACGCSVHAFQPDASIKALGKWNRRADDPTQEEIAKAKLVDQNPAYKKVAKQMETLTESIFDFDDKWKLDR